MKDTVILTVFKHFVSVAYFKCFAFPDKIIYLFFALVRKRRIRNLYTPIHMFVLKFLQEIPGGNAFYYYLSLLLVNFQQMFLIAVVMCMALFKGHLCP